MIDFTCYNTSTTIIRVRELSKLQIFEKNLEKILEREGNGKCIKET